MLRIGIAIVEQQGKVLVGVRAADTVLAGKHEFPGGKCLPDEEPSDCAVRECREETGLEVVPVKLLDQRKHSYSHGDVDLHFWLCRPLDGAAAPTPPFEWVPRQRLVELSFPEANRAVVEMLLVEPK